MTCIFFKFLESKLGEPKVIKGFNSNLKIIRYISTNPTSLLRTPFYDFHLENNGKMVDFAGWALPSTYNTSFSLSQVCKNIRKTCGLFDVSHMQKIFIKGSNSSCILDYLTTCDVSALKPGTGSYCLFLNSESGGIYDDAIVNRLGECEYYVVTNAACSLKIRNLIENYCHSNNLLQNTTIEFLESYGLLALQGPMAQQILKNLNPDFDFENFYFMDSARFHLNDISVILSRCGYTGEDGFEILIEPQHCKPVIDLLTKQTQVPLYLSGLVARDVLRIESGLSLYGNDINESITPVESGLMFTISKNKRKLMNFSGASAVMDKHKKILQYTKDKNMDELKLIRKKIGFTCLTRIPRNNNELIDNNGNTVGIVTSGTRSFELMKNIGIGYIDYSIVNDPNTKLYLKSETDNYEIFQCPIPFVPTKYYTRPKK